MILLFLYRIISAIVTIVVVVPLWFAYCIISFLFTLLNNLIYINLIQIEVPKESLEKVGYDKIMMLKFITAITEPFMYLWHNLKNIKAIKF